MHDRIDFKYELCCISSTELLLVLLTVSMLLSVSVSQLSESFFSSTSVNSECSIQSFLKYRVCEDVSVGTCGACGWTLAHAV